MAKELDEILNAFKLNNECGEATETQKYKWFFTTELVILVIISALGGLSEPVSMNFIDIIAVVVITAGSSTVGHIGRIE